jgi:hypothetical protein
VLLQQQEKKYVVLLQQASDLYVLLQHANVASDERGVCVAATRQRGERGVCVAATYTIELYVLLQHIHETWRVRCMCCCNIYNRRVCVAATHTCRIPGIVGLTCMYMLQQHVYRGGRINLHVRSTE